MLYTQLRSFHAVAREGSATAAARVLGISQPTLTTQIKELETAYGIELFHRRGRGLELTCLGEELLLKTQQFFRAEDDVVELIESAGNLDHGHLRIGAVGPFHVMKMLAEFHFLCTGGDQYFHFVCCVDHVPSHWFAMAGVLQLAMAAIVYRWETRFRG